MSKINSFWGAVLPMWPLLHKLLQRGLIGLQNSAEVSHSGAFLLLALFHHPPLVALDAGHGRCPRSIGLVKSCGLHTLEDVSLNVICLLMG
ncbi:hypothetical protein DPMN_004094 [Dreissena polymorpha]|uniref:Uncharacterized protein n=1 Tax=Dreissena polymorpha TaxID=45954 RepID=A0A9D4RT91_DREPO|nr:hypothetical protein DPMN_004094 [Dreissena polymorpha]